MKRSYKLGLLGLGLLGAVSAIALSATAAPETIKLTGTRVDNFMLADQTGMGDELYYFKDKAAVVIVTFAQGDAVSNRAKAALLKVKDSFKDKNVHFAMIDSGVNSKHDTFEGVPGSADLSILADELQLVGRSLGVTQTGEVFVINPKTWTVAYHGPIDASFADKKVANADLTTALNAVIAGKLPVVAEASVKGSKIAFPDRAKAAGFKNISYATEVAPVLADKCVVCHTEGGMGPFAMDKYEVVKAMAPMIRESLRTKRMPPFHSDNHGATWTDDMRPTNEQVKTIINWIEAGAPRGTGADPLPDAAQPAPKWP